MRDTMTKTTTEIKNEIITKNDEIKELQKKLELVKDHCPHPEYFVSCEVKDSEDTSQGGVGTYEFSRVAYKCSLCEGKFFGEYDNTRESRPTIEECINGRT
jgi:hypothetical protein